MSLLNSSLSSNGFLPQQLDLDFKGDKDACNFVNENFQYPANVDFHLKVYDRWRSEHVYIQFQKFLLAATPESSNLK